jgi:hypothetical protein
VPSPAALLRPSGEQSLDAIQHEAFSHSQDPKLPIGTKFAVMHNTAPMW